MSKRQSRLVFVLVFAVTASLATLASAAPDNKQKEADAKTFYEEGTKYYNLGDFPKAIDFYKKAYEAKPDSVLLYNIAQSYRFLNDFRQAIFFYKSFLRNMPNAPNKAKVEEHIKNMEEQLAKQQETATAPPSEPVAPGTKPKPDTGTRPGGTTPPSSTTPSSTETSSTGEPSDTKIPSPEDVAGGSETGIETSTPPGPAGTDDAGGAAKPIYKKWWFWAGIGAVAVGTAAVVIATSGGGGIDTPDSHFGSMDVF